MPSRVFMFVGVAALLAHLVLVLASPATRRGLAQPSRASITRFILAAPPVALGLSALLLLTNNGEDRSEIPDSSSAFALSRAALSPDRSGK